MEIIIVRVSWDCTLWSHAKMTKNHFPRWKWPKLPRLWPKFPEKNAFMNYDGFCKNSERLYFIFPGHLSVTLVLKWSIVSGKITDLKDFYSMNSITLKSSVKVDYKHTVDFHQSNTNLTQSKDRFMMTSWWPTLQTSVFIRTTRSPNWDIWHCNIIKSEIQFLCFAVSHVSIR